MEGPASSRMGELFEEAMGAKAGVLLAKRAELAEWTAESVQVEGSPVDWSIDGQASN